MGLICKTSYENELNLHNPSHLKHAMSVVI